VLMRLLAALASLALVAGVAGVATLVCAPTFRVAVTALVEVGAAYLLCEDVDYIVLLAWNWTGRGDPLKKVGGACVILLLGLRVLGLCRKFLKKPSVDFPLIKLESAGAAVLG